MHISLEDQVSEHFRITPIQKKALAKLGINSINDLLLHFPARYGDVAEARNIDSLQKGDSAVIYGKITGLKTSKGFRTKIPMADGYVQDETGRIHCVWFNQPYLAKMTPEGATVRIEGKVSQRRKKIHADNLLASEPEKGGELYFSNPKIEVVNKLPDGVGDSLFSDGSEPHTLYPVYPESRGITSLWIYHAVQKIFKSGILDSIVDPIPEEILSKYNLPTKKTALVWIHTPKDHDDALSARKRFSFEEIFAIQLSRQKTKIEYAKQASFEIEPEQKHVDEFVRRFPFKATPAQESSIRTIIEDMKKDQPMARLLEGDVGSGKTAVAAAAAYAVITSKPKGQSYGRLQIAYMCPTEILAAQHFESFIQFFSYMPLKIGLLTGSGCRIFPSKVNPKGWTDISRTQLLSWVANGEIAVLIGTHALIQKSVKFKHLSLAIIDEQHRFGMVQRSLLAKKNAEKEDQPMPHLLTMTATPIPRTLALTIYGDLDISVLDGLPEGRKPIITKIIEPSERSAIYEKVRADIVSGRQAYIICPRIDEPDPEKELALNAKSVTEEAKRLKKEVFPEYEIGVLHSRMAATKKDEVMNKWKQGKYQILCATSVVEVGVNVPNATVIIIEGAERFGLAQLHQLRGRVMRSSHQAYCYVFTETKSEKSLDRLHALSTAKNGFELAEIDMMQRGTGELSGARQWGMSDVAMEALKNVKMVEAARTEATRLISEDASLSQYPELKKIAETKSAEIHLE